MNLTGPNKTRKQKNPGKSDANVSGPFPPKNLRICSALVKTLKHYGYWKGRKDILSKIFRQWSVLHSRNPSYVV
jgi:hypothetical protein